MRSGEKWWKHNQPAFRKKATDVECQGTAGTLKGPKIQAHFVLLGRSVPCLPFPKVPNWMERKT